MIKLFARMPYTVFWSLDVLLSALTFGAKGETISARLWAASLPTMPIYQRWPAKLVRVALDWVVYAVFGEAGHTQASYAAYVAAKTAAA